MDKIKYTVCRYNGIGECPIVILLDRLKGEFINQFDNITDLINHLGNDCVIYFVSDINDNRIPLLHNWYGGVFDFEKLKKITNETNKART